MFKVSRGSGRDFSQMESRALRPGDWERRRPGGEFLEPAGAPRFMGREGVLPNQTSVPTKIIR